jgi:hypothetical protein
VVGFQSSEFVSQSKCQWKIPSLSWYTKLSLYLKEASSERNNLQKLSDEKERKDLPEKANMAEEPLLLPCVWQNPTGLIKGMPDLLFHSLASATAPADRNRGGGLLAEIQRRTRREAR